MLDRHHVNNCTYVLDVCSAYRFKVSVHTSNKYWAGTNANVYINLYDSHNTQCGEGELDTPKDNFERGS